MSRALVLAALGLALALAKGNLISSPANLKMLLDTETVLLETFERYIDVHEEKTNYLRRLLERMRLEHEEGGDDDDTDASSAGIIRSASESHFSNPVAAFRLVARLTSGWQRAEQAMSSEPAASLLASLAQRHDALAMPTDADLAAAASSLMRLQDTYRLETTSLARGVLNGVQYAAELSADDCFDLGKRIFLAENYQLAETWMEEALARHDGNTSLSKADIMGYIAFSRYQLGDSVSALKLTYQSLALDPNNELGLKNLAGYQDSAAMAAKSPPQPPSTSHRDPGLETYKALCRGESLMDEATRSTLRCRYAHHDSWFLRLAPLKEEEAFLSPRILLYHDVISDAEIDAVVAIAQPKLASAMVIGSDNGSSVVVESYRIARSGWLTDDEDPAVASVSRRAAHMLGGLSLTTAEQLQVGSYGIGGHYEPHYDFARNNELEAMAHLNAGNRIATVLFYMNDVELGGATAFPELNVSLFPEKGAAAVWFNLHRDGEGDMRTKHAGCPVLAGSKWVCNKWFHERDQEVLRPCGLVQDSVTF